ncbi:hypothetical protein LCGC14_1676180 [marine sediment metagenome]|uniref:Uncharacterized protein n=1 Tax=marine sediment metagenome TaxID=412755 RepID=A0A0F9HQN0_9ZZZZ
MTHFLIVILCGFIFYMTGLAAGDVGETAPVGVFEWWLPLLVFLITGVPALLGFEIGRRIAK